MSELQASIVSLAHRPIAVAVGEDFEILIDLRVEGLNEGAKEELVLVVDFLEGLRESTKTLCLPNGESRQSLETQLPPEIGLPEVATVCSIATSDGRRLDSRRLFVRVVDPSVKWLKREIDLIEPPPKPLVEKRRSHRYPLEVLVSLTSDNNFFVGQTENISDGGVFIATFHSFAVGEELSVRISLEDSTTVEVVSEVVWVRSYDQPGPSFPPGVGLRFVDLSDDHKKVVRTFLRKRDPLHVEL